MTGITKQKEVTIEGNLRMVSVEGNIIIEGLDEIMEAAGSEEEAMPLIFEKIFHRMWMMEQRMKSASKLLDVT
jgi:hypothetical protein